MLVFFGLPLMKESVWLDLLLSVGTLSVGSKPVSASCHSFCLIIIYNLSLFKFWVLLFKYISTQCQFGKLVVKSVVLFSHYLKGFIKEKEIRV